MSWLFIAADQRNREFFLSQLHQQNMIVTSKSGLLNIRPGYTTLQHLTCIMPGLAITTEGPISSNWSILCSVIRHVTQIHNNTVFQSDKISQSVGGNDWGFQRVL